LPESLTTMYASIFSGCENLKEITIPKFVTKMDKPLSGSSIDTVIFEDGRESIPQNACQNATSLKEVVIPSEVTSIGAYAFSGCTSLTNDGINIPNGVTAINSNTFENCTSLTGKGVDIPNGVTTIGSYAFSGCTGITEFSLPDTVTEIGYASYKSCNFSNITILNSVKTINEYAFSDCNELTDVTLPENLVTIKNGIFSGCTKLTEITIPKLVTTMNESLSGSSIDTVIFEDGRESIPENACKGGSNIKKVVIPSSVRIINAYAFSNCNELTDITLPANLVTIRDSIFSGCTKLTEITIPKLVTTMNESLSGSSIDTVIFEDGRESIPEKACKDGNNIKKVVIPSSVKYIFSYAFSGCTSLTNSGLDIPNGVTTIGSYAFSDCTGIAEFSLPNTVETIDEYAFNGCKFKEVILPKNLTTIGSYAFQNCSELTYVSLPEHLIVMHACVFNNCTKLKEITIPPNVTRMDYPVDGAYVSAFSGSSITKIILESGRTYIPAYSFKDAKVLDTLVVPKEVTAVGKQAFFNSGIKKFYGYADSYAQTYANNNFIEFVELDCAHDNTIIKYAYPASDDEEGYTGNIYCADCGLLLTEGENIPTTGHSFEIVDKKEPTCTKVGSIEYVCSDCGISYTDFVPATNHTFSITRIDSTCSQTGYTIYTCDKCGYSYESDYTPILEHKYIENIIEYPTCTQTGMAEYTCSLCGDNYTEILSMKEHEYQVQVFEPTPNEKGYTEHTCNNCGYSYIDNIIPYASDYSVFDKLLSDLHDIYFPEDYSESSYEHLMELYDIYAELIYGSNEGASQIEIDNAISELLTGISNLEPYLTLNVSSQNGTYTASYTEQPDIYKYYKLLYGTAVTLKATPDEGYKFVGWYDTINNRYFSNNEEYTFKITNNTRLKAIFVKEGSSSLIFTTYSNWIKTTVTKTIDEWNDIISIDDLLPEVPYRYGYSNGHWVYDNEDVLAKLQSGENVYLIPEYDTNDTTLPTPPSPNDDTPVLDLYYKLDAESDIGSFLMAVGIPEDCKVETIAIAFYYDKVENAFYPQEFYLYINNKMLVSRFSTDEIDDIYIANMNNFTDKYNWAVRGYISYYDADGNLKTVYSNQINIINREQV
jgi:hypothetical protein